MKKMIGGIAAAAVAGSLALAAPAHATTAVIGSEGDMSAANYTAELRYAGMNQTIWQSRGLGPFICNQRAEGLSEDSLIRVTDGPDTPWNVEQAVAIVIGAEFHFCPEYEGRGGRSAPPPPLPPPMRTLEPNPPGPPSGPPVEDQPVQGQTI